MDILERVKKERLYFEGAAGTILQSWGLRPGELPELWNLSHPDRIRKLHHDYLMVGCNIMKTNTFGANSLKYTGKDGMPALSEVVSAAVSHARAAREETGKDAYVALDIGPSGKMLEPLGDYPFEKAASLFSEVVEEGVKAGVDLILIETMNDSYETKAAVLAAKEHSTLPVFVTNVYDEQGKLMTGANPQAMTAMLEGLRVDALGMNCSLGPAQMKKLVPELVAASSLPVIVNPNAGLPRSVNGQTVYDVDADEFAGHMVDIVKSGASIIGGCCGTTPEYMQKMIEATKDLPFQPVEEKNLSVVSSYTHAVYFGQRPILIGERINPTGKKKMKQALKDHDLDYLLDEGIRQEEAGVDVLDVNVGLPEIDEDAMMQEAVRELQAVCDLPLQIDSTGRKVMEHALRIYNGKAMINSVNGKKDMMETVFPLAAKYGGLIVALTLDEEGIPATAEGRVAVAKKILETAATYGIKPKDIIFDPLAMTVSADDHSALVTLEAVRRITEELGCNTTLGVSNISFGLPRRNLINGTFFALAMENGLKAAIMNPFSQEMMLSYKGFLALSGQDPNCMGYINYVQDLPQQQAVPASGSTAAGNSAPAAGAAGASAGASGAATGAGEENPLQKAIVKGLKEKAANLTKQALETEEPLDIINREIIPALDIVGQGFEKKTLFLPQLLVSAEAATAAFDVVKEKITASGEQKEASGAVVLATVKGDIHDIGKNIVKVLLENYGFEVVDLGRDVPPEKVVEVVKERHLQLAGLSALMTTTVPSMEETIRRLHEEAPWCKTVVGGAVMTKDYADMIHADYYAKDAMETVRYAEKVFGVE